MTCAENENFCVICDPTNTGGGSELDCALPNCMHEFHYECIYTWVTSRTNTCPVCRHAVNSLRHTTKVNGCKETKKIRIKTRKYEEDESDILYVVQHLSDSEDLDDVSCNICLEDDGRDDALLLCSSRGCPSAAHYDCLDPPLLGVPDGDWFCPACAQLGQAEHLSEPDQRLEMHNCPPSDSTRRYTSVASTVQPLRNVSALDNLRMNNEDIFATTQNTPQKNPATENRAFVLLDSPENATLARRKPIEKSPPRLLNFQERMNDVDGESKIQPAYSQWKKTGPGITPAPSITGQMKTKPTTVHTSEEFSSYVQRNSHDRINPSFLHNQRGSKSFHDTLAVHRYRSPAQNMIGNQLFPVTPAMRIGTPLSIPQESIPSKSPHPRFPIHRNFSQENQGDHTRRKRPAIDESLSQSSLTHEIKETLKDLTRNQKITPHEAVCIQRNVEKEPIIQQRSASVSKVHHLIEKYLKALPKNR